MSALAGKRIARLELHIPSSGGWLADVTLENGAVVAPGPATLQVADLALVGSVLPGRTGLDAPELPHLMVAGGAGWDVLLPLEGRYASAVGVRLSTVLRDLSALAGEPYDAPSEAVLPPGYGWSASTPRAPLRARDVLAELVARGAIPTWRVAPSGRTVFASWPSSGAADGFCRITARNLTRGLRHVGLDTVATAFVPGATLEGIPIARVIFHETGGALSAEVWTS